MAMPFECNFILDDSSEQVSISTGLHRRKLESVYVRLDDDAVWCFHCDRLVNGEVLPPLASLRENLKEMKERLRNRRRDAREAQRVFNTSAQSDANDLASIERERHRAERNLAEAKALVRWRRWRKSPPRCLQCGSTAIAALPSGRNEFPHPAGRGMICLVGSSIWTGTWEYFFYDAEGNHIPDPPTHQI